MSDDAAMIRLDSLTKRFDGFVAVSDVSLSVAAGEVLALLGPNGAGKTTTVRMLAAILQPTSGKARVAGYDVVEQAGEVRRRIGLLTEHPGLYLRMRGRDYLDFFGRLMGVDADVRARRGKELLAHFDMADAWDRRMGTYSKGMRQKMALVRAILHEPSVLLLDEPTSAMDPHSAKLVRDAIRGLRDNSCTIVLCTHNLPEAEMLADRIAIIRRGTIVELGTPSELKERLLGPPIMELHLTQPVDGVIPLLSDIVTIRAQGDMWVRYETGCVADTSPILLRRLVEHGVGVATLSEAYRSLEDVYLQVVGE